MALNHSPRIVTNGLVFAYDMANSQKSWKGAPTTNKIISDPIGLGVYAYVSGPIPTSGVVDARGITRTVNRYAVTSTAGARRAAIRPTGLTTGVTYAFSYVYRNNGAGTDIYVDASKGNPEGGTNNNTFATNTITTENLGNGWVYVKYVFSYSACPTGACVLAYGNSSENVGETFDVYNEQFEINSVATPFVNGTRSNTQAILDLTNNNTITASSLTYNSDGTFSFDGINNYVSFGDASAIHNIGGTSAITVEAWVKYDTYVGNNGAQTYSVVTHKGTPWTWLMENPSNTGRIRFTIGGADVACSDTSTHPLNTWMQWVGVYDGTFMRFYRNGELKNSVGATGTLGTNSVAATLGEYSGSYRMDGNIAGVKIYNLALSAAEVKQNFNALRGRYGL